VSDTRKYYYVMRIYTHTDLKQLWKVESRRIRSYRDALFKKDHLEGLSKNKGHEFFIVIREE